MGRTFQRSILVAGLLLMLFACDTDTTQPLIIEVAFPELSFEMPVDLQHPGDGTDRLFVIEQEGVIRVFENDPSVTQSQVFLDIRDQVLFGGEQGLLGLAFHPDYENNGYFYIDFTADEPRRTIIACFSVDPDNPDRADVQSIKVLLEVNQPYGNHNGGQISFGPAGYLYVSYGDGGAGGDPEESGQDPTTLLGSIIRIDVDSESDGRNYGIPPDNPFVGNTSGYREEIFAYGLRNPWRFSFDAETGELWTGDVGQNLYEEIDIVVSGANYGWDEMEGMHCFEPPENCDQSGLRFPIFEYGRDAGSSITGGFVYRGEALPDLFGKYIYADYITGRIWALTYNNGLVEDNIELFDFEESMITSFGVDRHNELYFCSFDGKIYHFRYQ